MCVFLRVFLIMSTLSLGQFLCVCFFAILFSLLLNLVVSTSAVDYL